MRQAPFAALLLVLASLALAAPSVSAAPGRPASDAAPKPWCAPELTELSDHVCYADGGAQPSGRRTLVIYLHGALATRHGFAYMQQRAMAAHAKRHSFTVLIPTGPSDGVGFVWPSSAKDLKDKEPAILAGLQKARIDLEKSVGHPFDETFVVGFSSGAYYGSSLALRSALDADGYLVLAGGTSWVSRTDVGAKHVPIFVGVSAADPLSRNHSHALAGALRGMQWPYRAEERAAGHGIDDAFMEHGLTWLRAQTHTGT
jgi:predicted esterase